MPRLPDGTIIPSFFGVGDRARSTPGSAMTMSDVSLRVGEIIDSHGPTDPENVSKVEVEYIVQVNYRDGTGNTVQTPYRCVIKDGFGSQGDRVRHSLRQATGQKKDKARGNGAIVLIACINGDKAQAVILDCLRHPNRQQPDPQGRFLDFEFNGVGLQIGDDGSMTLTVPGPTDTDGQPDHRDQNNHGSKVTFAKTGDITIDDQAGQSIRISPGQNLIDVRAKDSDTTIKQTWKLQADHVVVQSDNIELGDRNLDQNENGVVIGKGIDTLTGMPFWALGDTTSRVKAKD